MIIARLGNHFNPPFGVKKAPISEEKAAEALAEFTAMVDARIERDKPKLWVGINGHYHHRDGIPEGEALLATAAIHRAYQEQNSKPNVVVLDTLTPTHAIYPLGVRSDHFHAGGFANYVEGLAIVKTLCEKQGVSFPAAIQEHVDGLLATAADQRDAFTFSEPSNPDPKTTYQLGDSIDIAWNVEDPEVKGIYVLLHRLGHDDYYLSDRIDTSSEKSGKMSWVVSEPLPTVGNRMDRVQEFSRETAKKEHFARKIPGGQRLFCIRIVNADDPATYTFSNSFTINFPKKIP